MKRFPGIHEQPSRSENKWKKIFWMGAAGCIYKVGNFIVIVLSIMLSFEKMKMKKNWMNFPEDNEIRIRSWGWMEEDSFDIEWRY